MRVFKYRSTSILHLYKNKYKFSNAKHWNDVKRAQAINSYKPNLKCNKFKTKTMPLIDLPLRKYYVRSWTWNNEKISFP